VSELIRKNVIVSGVVQGVGFRPFVYRLAERFGLAGLVRNTSGTVEIDVEGSRDAVERFLVALRTEAPKAARIDSIATVDADPIRRSGFSIAESDAQALPSACIPADISVCSDCAGEIFDPDNRRFFYPFTNCTNCGPRFTIIQRVPYDRPNTTMDVFDMCAQCESEYRNPVDRRFHAEPIACPICGPKVWLEQGGVSIETDAITKAADLLRKGKIVAIKGLGGFHLACDARNDDVVRELRRRKGRVSKPFALMVKDLVEAEKLCVIDEVHRKLLTSREMPIVLAEKKRFVDISENIAPGTRLLGLMLPYTPLHLLLFEHSPAALVMTSGNLSEEPLAFTNTTAKQKLAKLADAFLMHDRDISVPCDDSVIRPVDVGLAIMVRRARGYVPVALPMPFECECILGVGADQKNTFCLAWDRTAVCSQHIGDLDSAETFDHYQYVIAHFQSLFGREPKIVVHDLHPGYMSTHYAHTRLEVELFGVQHHHAHIAACLAENDRTDRCIGLALDGTGYGPDGSVWGGEILSVDLSGFKRIGYLSTVRMPGGDAAIRDPRRMAAAYARAAFGTDWKSLLNRLEIKFSEFELDIIERQMQTGFNSPITSSAGRLFDAVSAAIGICSERTYEGQPAVELEMIADETVSDCYNSEIKMEDDCLVLDTISIFNSTVEDWLAGAEKATVAGRFHNSLVNLLAQACVMAREVTGLNIVALSGGVFQNALILSKLSRELINSGFEVIVHRILPPNDACISYGQVVVCASQYR